MAQGKLSKALDAYQQGLAIDERLAGQDKTDPEWQRDLLVSFTRVGDVLLAQGKLPEALDAYQQGLAIAERLAELDKPYTDFQRDLSVSYEKVGDVQRAQGKLPEALDAFQHEAEESAAVRGRVAALEPAFSA